MAFDIKFFAPIAGSSIGINNLDASPADATTPRAPSLFSYLTADTHATVDTAGYFNTVRSMLKVGDFVLVSVINASGVLQTAGYHVVITKSATAVDVVNVTAATVTNTD